MKVILRENVRKVGNKYEIVEVSDGYALNYLIPHKLAELATSQTIARIESAKDKVKATTEAQEAHIVSIIEKLAGKTVHIKEKTNENGNLFGKVDVEKISESLSEIAGEPVPSSIIMIPHPFKQVGDYEVNLLLKKVKKSITVSIQSE